MRRHLLISNLKYSASESLNLSGSFSFSHSSQSRKSAFVFSNWQYDILAMVPSLNRQHRVGAVILVHALVAPRQRIEPPALIVQPAALEPHPKRRSLNGLDQLGTLAGGCDVEAQSDADFGGQVGSHLPLSASMASAI